MFTKLSKSASYKMKIVSRHGHRPAQNTGCIGYRIILEPKPELDAVEDALRYGVIPAVPAMGKLENPQTWFRRQATPSSSTKPPSGSALPLCPRS